MDSQNIPHQGIKRRRSNSPPGQSQRLVREKVNILEDTWLEALKFLTCLDWSKKRFVSRQINGIAERNILRLPKMVLDSAEIFYLDLPNGYWKELKDVPLNKHTIVAFDTVIQGKKSLDWFMDRGYILDTPEGIPVENALISAENWKRSGKNARNDVHVCIHGFVQENIPLLVEERYFPWIVNQPGEFKKPTLFYAQFDPVSNRNSWMCLAQFLKVIYHPTSYLKEVKMFPVNQNFIDFLKCNIDSFENESRYIRCESFLLREIWVPGETDNSMDLPDSLKWLKRNVRAERLQIPYLYCDVAQDPEAFVLLANFLLEASGAKQCASEKMIINVSSPVPFLKILIEKFHTIPLIESGIPTIEFATGYRIIIEMRVETHLSHLGPNLIDQGVDSRGAKALYIISNGQNRMRISFCWEEEYDDDSEDEKCNISVYSI